MTKTQADYADKIKELYSTPCKHSGQDANLEHCVKEWAQRVPIVFYRANQEKEPYMEDELGCSILPMPLMKESGIKQIGDYICYIPDYEKFTGILWEKKGVSASGGHDIYQTLVHDRERFVREIEEYTRQYFDIMIVGIESTEMQYLAHMPNGKPGASLESRHALWKHLEGRFNYRVRFDWLGSRKLCCRMLVEENRIWLKYHYAEVMGL